MCSNVIDVPLNVNISYNRAVKRGLFVSVHIEFGQKIISLFEFISYIFTDSTERFATFNYTLDLLVVSQSGLDFGSN